MKRNDGSPSRFDSSESPWRVRAFVRRSAMMANLIFNLDEAVTKE